MSEVAIICVDDEPAVLDTLKEQIKNFFGDRYLCEVAESVEEAWEIIEELNEEGIRICLIVSDWLMPRIRGDEFLIDVHRRFPEIIKVMLTGQADAEAVERAYKQAALHRCLRKPWKEDELIEAIQSGMEKLYAARNSLR
ncbi:response regulator [Desulfococcaceae bacterium HSG8]|nr:response regulator [Desulfococcaceae bacterium HSG8]